MDCKTTISIFFACALLFCGLGAVVASPEMEPEMEMSAEEFMYTFFDVFNDRDIVALDDLFSYPFYGIQGGQGFAFEQGPLFNYTDLIEVQGWNYSAPGVISAVVESDTTAIVYTEFCRHNNDDMPYFCGFYYSLLAKMDGEWKFVGSVVPGPVINTGLDIGFEESTSPDTEQTVLEYMDYWVDTFNGADTEATDAEYNYPFWILRMGETLLAESGPLVNYEYLIGTEGWAYSEIDYAEVIVESESAAIVRMEFSRYNADDVAYFSGVNYFLLVKQDGKWIFDAAVAPGVPPQYGIPEDELSD